MFTIIIFLIYACDMKNFAVVLIDIEILENRISLYSFYYLCLRFTANLFPKLTFVVWLDISGNINITMFMQFD